MKTCLESAKMIYLFVDFRVSLVHNFVYLFVLVAVMCMTCHFFVDGTKTRQQTNKGRQHNILLLANTKCCAFVQPITNLENQTSFAFVVFFVVVTCKTCKLYTIIYNLFSFLFSQIICNKQKTKYYRTNMYLYILYLYFYR